MKMRMTKNRLLIMQALAETNDYETPPYSASSVRYILENAFNYQWQGYDMKTLPSIIQIHRTLRDLWQFGLIVGNRFKCDFDSGCLPYWEIRFQLSRDVERNHIISECNALHRAVNKAKNGINLFGGVFDKGLPPSEVKALSSKVKVMMQRTHPDKATGFEYEFKMMQQAHEMIKGGIPEPMPTHDATNTPAQQKLG
jgi:hypothetical protein